MNENTLKALIAVASKSTNPECVEGVMEVQKLMQENTDLKTSIKTLQEESAKNEKALQDELDKATRTMARLIAQNGCVQEEDTEEQSKQTFTDLAKKLFA